MAYSPSHPGALGLPDLPRPASARLARVELLLVALTVFLAPINYLRAEFAYVTLSDLFAVLSLAVMVFRGTLPLYPFGRASLMWYGSVFLLILGLLLGSTVNGDLANGVEVVGQYCVALVLLPLLILCRPRFEMLLLIKVFVLSLVVVMLHGAYVIAYTPGDLRFVSRSGRLSSLIERENAAGALAAMGVVFTLWLYFIKEIRLFPLLLALVPLGYGLLLTGSNTGFFLTAIGALTLAVLSGAPRILGGVVLCGVALLAVIVTWGELFLPEIFLKRVFGALQTRSMSAAGTFDDRMFLIREAFGITRDTLAIGLGANQYRLISAHGAPVHSTYLLLLAEGGLISLLGHAGLLLASFHIGWPALIDRRRRWMGVLTLTILLMFIMVQTGIAHVYARFWVVPWYLALSASLQGAGLRDSTRPEHR
ncbi:MAG: O-antigen ligase family protein [Celeribacter sp.]|jgi:O-antigen ligase